MKYEIEDVQALFSDENIIIVSPIKVKRVSVQGFRYYCSNGEIYPSVTTILSKGLPTSNFLIDWIANMGKEKAESIKEERSCYGTLMHQVYSDFLILREANLEEVEYFCEDYAKANGYAHLAKKWSNEIKKDLLAFAQFCFEYNVTPISIEYPVVYNDSESGVSYAGMVDLLCELDYREKGFFGDVYLSGAKKGEPKETAVTKRVIALIDYKSNRTGTFYDSAIFQLPMYQLATEQTLNISPEKLFNFSPKEWRTVPDYHLREQSEKVSLKEIEAVYTIFRRNEPDDMKIVDMDGVVIFGSEPTELIAVSRLKDSLSKMMNGRA